MTLKNALKVISEVRLQIVDNAANDYETIKLDYVAEMSKYFLDCDSFGDTQFALYEDGECILRFDYDDIPGLRELESQGRIVESFDLISTYLVRNLGFLPDYVVC